jgi:hypothetical protein
MKAQFINEVLERGKKPIGIKSSAGINRVINEWQKKGLKFGHFFFEGDQVEKTRDLFSKYYPYIEKYLNKLHNAGVEWKDMTLWGDHVDIKSYRISKGNWSLFQCLKEEDAKNLINVLENITTGNQAFNISEDKENINLMDKIRREIDPEEREWIELREKQSGEKRRTDLDFLDHIEETRKKLNQIK